MKIKMKSFIASLIAILMLMTAACSSASRDVRYSVSAGVKADCLTEEKQAEIDKHVNECKINFAKGYLEAVSNNAALTDKFIAFTDVFIYDFTRIDEISLTENESKTWDAVKSMSESNAAPIMYVELKGYAPYYTDNSRILNFDDLPVINGFFIYGDGTVKQRSYRSIELQFYSFELLTGTELINCGSKYAQELRGAELESYISSSK